MGQEIGSTHFSDLHRQQFGQRLREETLLATQLLAAGAFSSRAHVAGCELEAWLVDVDMQAAPFNETFLGRFADSASSAELARFNVEFNTPPQPLCGQVFREMEGALDALLVKARDVARSLELDLVLIGTLPTLRDAQLTLKNLSGLNRYKALNEQILAARNGRGIGLDIRGREHLRTVHRDVMLEAATTSFQIHWQVSADVAANYYNAALLASAPVLAVGVNSPFLFQKDLWDETRIPLFEQAIPLSALGSGVNGPTMRVGFGSGWIRDSVADLFLENMDAFPVLLPIVSDEPANRFSHLRLHNGTVWRWNRPVLGFDFDGTPHIRLEHRALPAGPTVVDMVANAAFFYGLVEALVRAPEGLRSFPFGQARRNFYAAARFGLRATLGWLDGTTVAASALAARLTDLARQGLAALAVDSADIDRYLSIIEQRIRSRQTGSEWQRGFLGRHRRDFSGMTREYREYQESGRPVHEWGL